MPNRIMISQPMAGKSYEEIVEKRDSVKKSLEAVGYEVVDSLFKNGYYGLEMLDSIGVTNVPLFYLAKSLEIMSKCETVYFCNGWHLARGCIIEHKAAKLYGLKIIYENHYGV